VEADDFIIVDAAQTDSEIIKELQTSYVTFAGLANSSTIGYADNSTLIAFLVSTPSSLVNTTVLIAEEAVNTSHPTSQPTSQPSRYGINVTNTATEYGDSTADFDYSNFTDDRTAVSPSLALKVDCDAGGLSDVKVYYNLHHDNEISIYGNSHTEIQRLNYTTVCKRRHASVHEYFCPDTGDMVRAVCDGTRETILTFCPQVERVSSCAMVDTTTGDLMFASATSSYSPCTKVDSLSNSNVTVCECTMCASDDASTNSTSRRRLSGDADDDLSLLSTEELELVAVTSYSSTDMLTTIIDGSTSFSSDDSFAGSFPVLVTFMCVWLLLPLAVWMHRTQLQTRRKTKNIKIDRKVAPAITDGAYSSAGDDSDDNDGVAKMPSHAMIASHGDGKGMVEPGAAQRDVIESFKGYINSIMPELFTAPTQEPAHLDPDASLFRMAMATFKLPKKMWKELRAHHIYGTIVTEDSVNKAFVKLIHALTAMTVTLFVLAVLYDLQFPDSVKAICEAHDHMEACQLSMALIDDSYYQCVWDAEYRECGPVPTLVVPISTYLVLTMWFCMLAVPLLLLQEWLFTHILMAPTAADLDQRERKVFLQSALKMAKQVRPATAEAIPMDNFDEDYDDDGNGYDEHGDVIKGDKRRKKKDSKVPTHYHGVVIDDLQHHAQHHLKQGKLHQKTRQRKALHRAEKMMKKVQRQRIRDNGSDDDEDGERDNEKAEFKLREQMVSRAVLISSRTQRLQGSLARALETSLLARTQIDSVRKRYLSKEAMQFLKYEVEKKDALSRSRGTKSAAAAMPGGKTDGSMITMRNRNRVPTTAASDDGTATLASREGGMGINLDDDDDDAASVGTAVIYGLSDKTNGGAANADAAEGVRGASFTPSRGGENGDGDDDTPSASETEDDYSSDDSLDSWASDHTDLDHRGPASVQKRKHKKHLSELKKKLQPDVLAHLRKSTKLERFQQKRELLYEEAIALNHKFHKELILYRNSLKYKEQVRELDKLWAVTAISTGNTGRGLAGGVGGASKKAGDRFSFDAKAEVVMAAEIEQVLRRSGEALSLLRSLPPTLRGPELVRLFMLDLLGRDTVAAKVMRTKMNANTNFRVVSHSEKMAAAVAVGAMNLIMLYIVLSYAATKSSAWQAAWLTTAFVNIFMHLGLNQIFEALLLHYYIPHLVSREALAVRKKLAGIVEYLFNDTYVGDGAGAGATGHGGMRPGGLFSSTSYFYVSHFVASQCPDLIESALVLSYRNPLPPDSLRTKWLPPSLIQEMERAQLAAKRKEPKTAAEHHEETQRGLPSRELTADDIHKIALHRLHAKFHYVDQERTLTGRLYLTRQKGWLYAGKWLSQVNAVLSGVFLWIGALEMGVQRLLIQVFEPILIAGLVFCAVAVQKQSEALLITFIVGMASLIFALTSWIRWAYRDRHKIAVGAVMPAPTSESKKSNKASSSGKGGKSEKGKYGNTDATAAAGSNPLNRFAASWRGSSTSAGGEESSLLEGMHEHMSVDDMLSDLGSVGQIQDDMTLSSSNSASDSNDQEDRESNGSSSVSIGTDELGTISDSSEDDEVREEREKKQQKTAFEAGVAAGIAAAAGAGIVTVPVTIRSKSSAGSETAPSDGEGYKKGGVVSAGDGGGARDWDDHEGLEDWEPHRPAVGAAQNRGEFSSSDSYDEYDPHHRHGGALPAHGHAEGSTGSSEMGHEHHLSSMIREQTKKPKQHNNPASYKPKKGDRKAAALEAALKPFEAPRPAAFKGLEGTYDRQMAELTKRAKAKRIRVEDSISTSDNEFEDAMGSPDKGKKQGGAMDDEYASSRPEAGRKLLYEDFLAGGNDFKVGGMRSMDIKGMHKQANLGIKSLLDKNKNKNERGAASDTGRSSSQYSMTDSPPTTEAEDNGKGNDVSDEEGDDGMMYSSAHGASPSATRVANLRKRVPAPVSRFAPHRNALGGILGKHTPAAPTNDDSDFN
jgi:hypothetical protein